MFPTNAAIALTLKSPPSVLFSVQADRLPDSKPSEKIRSDALGVLVGVGVRVSVGVGVLVGVSPGVGVLLGVGVSVGVGEGPSVGVSVGVAVGVGLTPMQLALPTSVKVCPTIGTNSQS